MSSKDLVPVKIEQYGRHYDDRSFFSKLKKTALKAGRKVVYNALLLFYTLTDTSVPLRHKRIIIGALGYFILPIDFIPDIIPGTGFADDLLAILYAIKVISDSITPQIRAKAEAKCNEYFNTDTDTHTPHIENQH